ncbi:phage virion morphogenesis protein [Gordonia terrae]|nr:phage virion morphogenesis protein [Gordonia terrae]
MADSLDVRLKVDGDAQLKAMLSGLSLDLQNLRPAMDEVGRGAVRMFSGPVFASRGQRLGESWPRLSTDYAAQKAKRYAGRPVLVRTGQMQSRFGHQAAATSVTIYNLDPKFKFHQSNAPRSKIPRRAMIGIYQGLDNDVRNTVAAVIARKIKERSK